MSAVATTHTLNPDGLSIVQGGPLEEEPGIGALTLAGYLMELREKFSAREALVWHAPDGEILRLSYEELYQRAVAAGRALLAQGVGKGSRVGVMMTNRPEWLAAVFGASLAGCVAVPLSTFSTPAELEYLLQSSCLSVLLFERRVLKNDFADMLLELEPDFGQVSEQPLLSEKFPYLRYACCVGGPPEGSHIDSWADFLNAGKSIPTRLLMHCAATISEADPAMLFFSSGSSGKPKGVLNSHFAVSRQCWRWARWNGLEGDVCCWAANGFFWSGTFGQALGSTLSVGGSMILQPTFQAGRAIELIQREKVNFVVAWPHQFAQIADSPGFAGADFSALHYVDPNNPMSRHPSVHSDWEEPNSAYGNTETFTINSVFPVGTPREMYEGTHGVPVEGNTIKIVDPVSGQVLPLGESGEIALKGPTLMMGYIGVLPKDTLDPDGYFHTGDGGFLDEQGRLHWEGRLSDIIKTGGANVSPLEVDNEIRAFPGVKVSQTVGTPHDTLGELVVSCVVMADGVELDEAELIAWLKSRLASYKVPRKIVVVTEADLSLTGSAKVKTAALRELVAKHMQE